MTAAALPERILKLTWARGRIPKPVLTIVPNGATAFHFQHEHSESGMDDHEVRFPFEQRVLSSPWPEPGV